MVRLPWRCDSRFRLSAPGNFHNFLQQPGQGRASLLPYSSQDLAALQLSRWHLGVLHQPDPLSTRARAVSAWRSQKAMPWLGTVL